jgi:CheY-specific phosphatase CheX
MSTTDINKAHASVIEHSDCVTEAAMEIFSSTCGQSLEPLQNVDDLVGSSVIGLISIVGGVEWSIFLGMPRETAVRLTAKFAGFEIPFDSDDMGDAVGELTNILAGEVKRRLERRNVQATISLPSVLRVESLRVLVQRGTSSVKSCFTCEAGTLWTGLVCLEEGGFIG